MSTPNERFAIALAQRLDAVVPRPLTVRAVQGAIHVYEGADSWGALGADDLFAGPATVVDEHGESYSRAARAASSARAALSSVQDCVARTLRHEWPQLAAGGMALPGARTDGVRVYLWYGPDERSAAVTLEPLVLADFAAPAT